MGREDAGWRLGSVQELQVAADTGAASFGLPVREVEGNKGCLPGHPILQ